ncbi:MAG: hypothetical protein ABSF80_13365, partial [Chitinispirillaceae bacterium]
AYAEDLGRKPGDECVGRTCRSFSEGRFLKCFGGFRRTIVGTTAVRPWGSIASEGFKCVG